MQLPGDLNSQQLFQRLIPTEQLELAAVCGRQPLPLLDTIPCHPRQLHVPHHQGHSAQHLGRPLAVAGVGEVQSGVEEGAERPGRDGEDQQRVAKRPRPVQILSWVLARLGVALRGGTRVAFTMSFMPSGTLVSTACLAKDWAQGDKSHGSRG